MRKPNKREWILIALALPVIALAVAPTDQDAVDAGRPVAAVKRAERKSAEIPRSADTVDLDLSQLRRVASVEEPGNAFRSKSWYVPPPPPPPAPPPKALPPPPPKAPPLPFTYLGKFQDAAAPVLFLVRGDRVLSVRTGDVIEGTYRVDGISGAVLGLTYLPLNIKQTLNIGNAG
jgi:hypothetical protein